MHAVFILHFEHGISDFQVGKVKENAPSARNNTTFQQHFNTNCWTHHMLNCEPVTERYTILQYIVTLPKTYMKL